MMASIYDLKPAFQNILRPLVSRFAKAGITANQVTLAALMLSVIAGGIVAKLPDRSWPLLLIPIVLFVRMALNAVDGMLAREFAMKSHLGAILNELGDVLSDAALYLPLALVPGFDSVLVVLSVLLAVISEMTGVVAIQIGASRQYQGPMGKSDRAFTFGLIALLVGLGVEPAVWLDIALWLITVLLALTIVNRVRSALKETAP